MKISSFAVPIMMLIIIAHGVFKNVSVYSAFLEGSLEGLKTAVGIIGPILAIFIAINMFRASGALTVVINLLKPVTNFLKIPEEMLPFAVLRPISGGGSLAMATDIFKKYGCDSFVGRVVSVLMGSTETTFYAISVYFGSIGIKNTRHTVKAALMADVFALFISLFVCRLMFT